MSQRDSGYARKERDLYETPAWVTIALAPHLRIGSDDCVYEPAAGGGKMVRALKDVGFRVEADDISEGRDFLGASECPPGTDAIITNPPYEFAVEFIRKALALTKNTSGMVAMLLRTDFDHARTRSDLFAGHPAFAKKVVLTKRIQWFEDSTGSPSFNHAWFIWDWQHQGAPTLAYGP
jgi:hypothetical protein